MEEIVPRIEYAFNVTIPLVPHRNRFPILPNRNSLVGIFLVVIRLHVPIATFENDTQEVCAVVVEKSVIITLNPVMNSHGIPKKDKRPPDQVRIIRVSKFFSPSNLKITKRLCIATSLHF